MQEVAVGETITYTYDVAWKESDTHWAAAICRARCTW